MQLPPAPQLSFSFHLGCSYAQKKNEKRKKQQQVTKKLVRSNPLFGLQKILDTLINCTFEVPYPFESGLAAIENQNESGCSYACRLFMEDQRGMRM